MPWEKVFRSRTPKEAIEFVSKLLIYDPAIRPKPFAALGDSYFDELRDPKTRLPNGMPLPDLFGWTPGKFIFTLIHFIEERKVYPELIEPLTPIWYGKKQ